MQTKIAFKHVILQFFLILSLIMGGLTFFSACSGGGGGGGSSSNTPDTPPDNPTPPDPATIAPVINKSVATTLDVSTAFLYTGTNPIQTGVAPDTIEAKRAAVIRGKVLDRNNTAVSDVNITILNHPEFGQTLSRKDGMFDMAINGGGYLTVNYEKSGYLPVQRQVNVPWQDFAHTPDVVMLAVENEVTSIDLAATEIQVARGSEVTDDDGTRRATMLFSPGTTAEMVLPDGTTQILSSLNMRATEYTVGTNGPQAMPAELPPNTAYTYAVELSADEALAAGATQVNFNQPVYTYVENFIGAPLGTAVPTGYYDKEKGQWIASQNGRVIQVLDITGGIATLDTDGDGVEDNASVLSELNITDSEREKIALLYSTGQELWRVPIKHLSSYDCNWPYGPPLDAEGPNGSDPKSKGGDPEDDPCEGNGSIIECQNQTLGERIAVVGTPYTLNYRSDRVEGRKAAYTVEIPLSGASIPASLKAIELEIHVAGRVFEETFLAEANLIHTFVWDGLDVYGRKLQGKQPITAYIRFQYGAIYYGVLSSFNNAFERVQGSSGIGGNVAKFSFFARSDIMRVNIGKVWKGDIGTWKNGLSALGGWSLSPHHSYSSFEKTLYYGDGRRSRGNKDISLIIKRVAGGGTSTNLNDEGLAIEKKVPFPSGIICDVKGNFYFSDEVLEGIFKVTPEGNISIVAGGQSVSSFYGDGGLATEARFRNPSAIAIGADGSIYIADTDNNRIRKITPDGIINTIAGNDVRGFGGDDGLATEASLYEPSDIALGADDTLYIADYGNHRVRRIGSDGIISTIVGNGSSYYGGDGSLATEVGLYPRGIDVASDGTMYVTDVTYSKVYKIGQDGIITRIAGNGSYTYNGDGILATEAAMYHPTDVVAASDGSLFICDAGLRRIRKVDTNGIITTIAGSGGGGVSGDNGLAAEARFNTLKRIAIGQKGEIYITDPAYTYGGGPSIRKVESYFSDFTLSDIGVASENGYELYKFNGKGMHLSTTDTLSGNVIDTFNYNDAGQLIEIIDRAGQTTTIERNGDGVATAIVAPFEERTALEMDSKGYLSDITNPANEKTVLTYSEDGLLSTMQNPEGGISRFTYDNDMGILTKDEDPVGGYQTFSRSDDDTGYTVTKTTAMGRITTFRMEELSTGARFSLKEYPDGSWNKVVFGLEGNQTTSYSDGTLIKMKHGADPRFGMQSPVVTSLEVITPDGLVNSVVQNRNAVLSDENDAFSLESLEDNVTINGRSFVYYYDSSAQTLSRTTPLGRLSKSTLDAKGRVVKIEIADNLDPVTIDYDSKGRVYKTSQGSQSWSYVYDKNRITSKTDAAGKQMFFAYDDAYRMIQTQMPEGEEIGYGYDKNSNMIQVIMPSSAVHTLDYTARDFISLYSPPGATGVSYKYDLDKDRTTTTLASTKKVENTFDSQGRWTEMVYPAATVNFAYVPQNNMLKAITRTPSVGTLQTLSYSYDGHLLKGVSFSGAAEGNYTYFYDNNFYITQMNLSRGSDTLQTTVLRDDDGLVIGYGPFTLSRNGPDASVSKISDGVLDVAVTYDSHGRVNSRDYKVNDTSVYSYTLTRDNVGKITQKVETKSGSAQTYIYEYDDNIQLKRVTRDGTEIEAYAYDSNGNRVSTLSASASYDSQDRVINIGTTNYTFDVDGYMTNRGNDSFEYSALGELLKVTMGSGDITYTYDGHRRLVGRSDASGSYEYLYGDPSNIFLVTAVVHPNGDLSRLYYNEENLLYAMERGTTRYYIGTDQIGTPKVVADSSGTIVKTLDYDSFGQLISDSDLSFEMPIGFAGGVADPVSGLVRFGLRDYDTYSGRWSARDPILFEGFQANLFVYVGNNPVGLRDPLGLWCVGASGYAGVGGGAELCCNNGKCSVCAEIGLGFGVSGGVGSGNAKGTGSNVAAEAGAGCGPLGAGVKCAYSYKCGSDCSAQADIGPLGIDSSGDVKMGDSGGGGSNFNTRCSFQGKLAGQFCKQF